jgi:ATP-dependent RNA helicase DDX27
MEASKTQNMIEHHDEIFSRPARTWFQTKEQRDLAKGSLTHNLTSLMFLSPASASANMRHDATTERGEYEEFGTDEEMEAGEGRGGRNKNGRAGNTKADKKNQIKIKRDEMSGLNRVQKRRKLQERAIKKWAGEEEMQKQAKQSISARQAKKVDRDRRSGKFVPPPENAKRGKKRARSEDGESGGGGGGGGGGSRFESDLTQPKKKQKAAPAFDSGGKGGKGGGKKDGGGDGEKKFLGKKRGNKAFKSKKRFQRRK